MKQKISMINTVIMARIAYNFYAVPFSLLGIIKLDKINNSHPEENMWTPQMYTKHGHPTTP
jgi:hypothetical protein